MESNKFLTTTNALRVHKMIYVGKLSHQSAALQDLNRPITSLLSPAGGQRTNRGWDSSWICTSRVSLSPAFVSFASLIDNKIEDGLIAMMCGWLVCVLKVENIERDWSISLSMCCFSDAKLSWQRSDMPKISVDTFFPDKEEVLDPETLGDGEFVHKLEINELSRISVR